jgi:hypothetical protein
MTHGLLISILTKAALSMILLSGLLLLLAWVAMEGANSRRMAMAFGRQSLISFSLSIGFLIDLVVLW